MNIPITWLRACVDGIDEDPHILMDKMTLTGTKAEGLTRLGEEIAQVVVGKVLSIERHPNADKLVITRIDIGSGELQIVTGAANLTDGDYVPVALDGARLAGGKKIKKGKLRGCESQGMLCAIDELGYDRHDYPEAPEDGIYVFQQPQPLGADVRPLLELTEDVIDFEVMSNRPDCNAVLGIAREAAATYGKTFTPPVITLKEAGEGHTTDHVTVTIKNETLCPRYIARVVKDVQIAPSPQWLRHRLTACGVRPINNIVDITNYVMLEYGQPMHAFDIDDITEHAIIVRNAEPGEMFTTLDGVQRTLDASMLVIADPAKAVAVAGVMGGENTMVTDKAKTILFESANFNGTSVRLTSKKLGLRTDSSARFEKGLDPNLAETAMNRAMELVELLGCGTVLPGAADVYPSPRVPHTLAYDPARINALLGIDLSAADMEDILNRLGIKARDGVALIPTFRADMTCEADIAEEVARFYGYNRIPARQTQPVSAPGGRSPQQTVVQKINTLMTSLGYFEAVTYPFESPKVFDQLLIPEGDTLRDAVYIQNPLGEDFSLMRTTTVNSLLESLSINFNRRNESARLYEIAYAYRPQALPLTTLPDEVMTLTVAAYSRENYDFYDIKGDMEELLHGLGIESPAFAPYAPPYMHPGRSTSVTLSTGAEVGYLGEIHPQVAENYQIDARVYVAVLELAPLIDLSVGHRNLYQPLPKFPAVERDLAFKVKREVSAAAVEAAIREKGGALLKQVRLFDVYQGRQIEEGFKSMAYTLQFRAADRTLTDEEVSKHLTHILDNLSKKLEAVLRDK